MDVEVSDVTSVLSRTPSTLRALLAGLPEGWLVATEGEGTFSPVDVVGHLIHAEETDWLPRIRLILASGATRPFVPFDRHGFRDVIRGRAVAGLLDDFDAARCASLDSLRDMELSPAQMTLTGRHPELGLVTLGQLLATWVVHDLNHMGQVVRVMSKGYADAVGPWKQYLGILNR